MLQQDNMEYEVVVVGGGLGGVAAAVTAAQQGARTLLVEESGLLGGVATNGLITCFSQWPLPGKHKPTFYEQLLLRLQRSNATEGAQFRDSDLTMVLDEMVIDAGVDVLFLTRMIGVETESRTVTSVQLHNKSGSFNVQAKIFIDGTGDGDLCFEAGASFEQGDRATRFGQPMTTAFYMAGVDFDKMPDNEGINRLYDLAKSQGEISNPRENVLYFKTVEPETLLFNTTRIIHHDATDGNSLSSAILEGRRQIREMVTFLKSVEGFEKAYLSRIAGRIGVRESRRICCEYRFTEADMEAGRKFDDAIMATGSHVDIHNPHGSGTRFDSLPEGTIYHVPFRCLIPKDLDNVIIGSRCLDASHEAFSAVRMMGHIGEYGRAAGFAAAWCIQKAVLPRQVNISRIQQQLGTLDLPKEDEITTKDRQGVLYKGTMVDRNPLVATG